MKKILIVGSLSSYTSDRGISGTVISLKGLIAYLEKNSDISVSVIDVSEIRGTRLSVLKNYICAGISLIKKSRRADYVMYNLSPDGYSLFSPFIIIENNLSKSKSIFRLFGGRGVHELSFSKRVASYLAMNFQDLILLQTKELIAMAPVKNRFKIKQLVTSRVFPHFEQNPYNSDRKSFIYMGHIKKDKGIFELIEAFDGMGSEFSLDIYGPFYDGLDQSIFDQKNNILYKGIVPPGKVFNVISNYKALVFPTYLAGEGYPGIVIECMALGLPILASNWKAIPEIVGKDNGILFEPKSSKAICEALILFGSKSRTGVFALSDSSFQKSKKFNSEVVNSWLLNEITSLK